MNDTHQRIGIHHQTYSEEIQKTERIACEPKNFKEIEEKKNSFIPNGFAQKI